MCHSSVVGLGEEYQVCVPGSRECMSVFGDPAGGRLSVVMIDDTYVLM